MTDLNKFGVTELDDHILTETEAGFGFSAVLAGIIAGIVTSALDHWSDIKKGVSDAIANS